MSVSNIVDMESTEEENTESESQIQSQSQQSTELNEERQQQRPTQRKKVKDPCIICGKACTSGTIQCTICTLWCHMACTGLSKEALRGLEVQAKEVGQAYWACRSCLSFSTKWNHHVKESITRQEATEKKVEDNRKEIDSVRKFAEETRKMMTEHVKASQNMAERIENALEDELREREARRLNLVIHGVPEIPDSVKNVKERVEMDKIECEKIFLAMGARTRGQNLRFCRRIGERGNDPRPIVIGLFSEEVKRHLLERARELRNTQFENVSLVPDLTKNQRKGEDRLRQEADKRNEELTEEDRNRNMKWMVVGRRGEKKIIKGTEREADFNRGPARGGFNGGYNRSGTGYNNTAQIGYSRDGNEPANCGQGGPTNGGYRVGAGSNNT